MDVVGLLKSQHRDIIDLFDQYETAPSLGSKALLFIALADTLAAHSAIEERIFYPALYQGADKDAVRVAAEEHLAAKRLLADLLKMSPSDANFDAKMSVLRWQTEHHIHEEETQILGAAADRLPSERRTRMAEDMFVMYRKLLRQDPRNKVPAETAEAAHVASRNPTALPVANVYAETTSAQIPQHR